MKYRQRGKSGLKWLKMGFFGKGVKVWIAQISAVPFIFKKNKIKSLQTNLFSKKTEISFYF